MFEPIDHRFDDACFLDDVLDETVVVLQRARRTEVFPFCGQLFLRLRFEFRILDETIDEHEQMRFHLHRLEILSCGLALLLDVLDELRTDLFRDVIDVFPTLGRQNRIDKTNLGETIVVIILGHTDFPTVVHFLVDNIFLRSIDVHHHVILQIFDLVGETTTVR